MSELNELINSRILSQDFFFVLTYIRELRLAQFDFELDGHMITALEFLVDRTVNNDIGVFFSYEVII